MRGWIARGWGAVWAALALLLSAAPAFSASLGISPLRVELAPGQATASLTLRNAGDAPVLVQVRTVAWSQKDGQDVFDATEDVIVSPPIFTVQGGGAQVIRVGLRRAPDAQRELSYRLFLQEVPPPPKPGQPGVQMALRIGLPIFVAPVQPQKPLLAWSAAREPSGEWRIVAENRGNLHVQVTGFRIVGPGEPAPELAVTGNAAYILPGQQQSWRVKPQAVPATGAKLQLQAQTDLGDMGSELQLDPP